MRFGKKQMRQAVIAVIAVAFVGPSGANGQKALPINISLAQAVDDYHHSSIFDRPIQYMPREEAFNFVRRATQETSLLEKMAL